MQTLYFARSLVCTLTHLQAGKRKPKNVKPPKPFVSRQDQEHKMQKVKRIDYDAPPPAGPFVTFFGMIFGTWVRGHMKPLSALLMYT